MSVVARGDKAINERYRPMRFSELIGNEQTKARLQKWMERGDKRSRAILLCGETSAGKTTTARILAMGLNCEKGDTVEPCLECPSCKAAMSGNAFHIMELNMSMLTKKDDSAQIIDGMYDACLTGRNKVYIFDEVQKLTDGSQNQLLKVVESPPSGVYFIFCTTEANRIIPALRNRFEQYTYTLPTRKDVAELLKAVVAQEKIELTDEQKKEFFAAVNGRPYREILFALEQFKADAGSLTSIVQEKVDMFWLAKEIIYKGNFKAFTDTLEKGVNIEYETLRNMMRTMAGKEIAKCGFGNIRRAALYYDILSYIEERKFFDSNNEPTGTALLWRICADLKEAASGK